MTINSPGEPDSSSPMVARLERSGFRPDQARALVMLGKDPMNAATQSRLKDVDFNEEQIDEISLLIDSTVKERRRLMNPFNLLEHPLSLFTGRLPPRKEE